jgi:3-oxoacyl-[acyl-carrier-protein] synthase III
MTLYLHGIGHFHPENHIDNKFLEELDIGTNEEWITSRVGIRDRRTVLPLDYIKATKNKDLRAGLEAALYSNAECGKRAALMAMERAGIQPSQIGMVIAGCSSPDNCIPAESGRMAKLLGIEVPCFDMHAACSTFGLHCNVTLAMGQNLPEYVLIVTPENTTRVTDFSDRSSAILFGDATAAAVVSTKVPSRVKTRKVVYGGSPAGCDEVVIKRTGHFFQNGAAVQKFAIKRMSELLSGIQAELGEAKDRLIYVGHQANLTMLEAVCRRCEIPSERHYRNIVDFGNQAAAGAPTVISQNWEKFGPGSLVGVVVVGSGLSWSSMLLEFE